MQRISRLLSSALIGLALMLVLPATARAQGPIIIGPGAVLAWEDTLVPDVATARSFIVQVLVDSGTPITLSPINCGPGPVGSPSTTFTCSSPLSQIPTGSHILTMTNSSGATTSLPSTPFSYVDLIIPVPQNLRIKGH